jgi:hypothetical protein
MGVITANRGIIRGNISYNLITARNKAFIVNNVAIDISKNTLTDSVGIVLNNITASIAGNIASRIYNNNCRGINRNIGGGRIQNNNISNGAIYSNITSTYIGISSNNIYSNIAGNIAGGIYSNDSLVNSILGNFVTGEISGNTCEGSIQNNYTDNIENNY